MKIFYMIFLAIVIFLLQACACECETQKPDSEKKLRSELKENAQDNKPETELTGSTNIKEGKVGPPKTVKIKFPSEPPELTPEQEREREEAFNQMNVPK